MLERLCRTLVFVSMLVAPSAALAPATFSMWVGSREEVVARMIALANLKPVDVVTDLGSGLGRGGGHDRVKFHHQHVFDGGSGGNGIINRGLERESAPASVAAVGGDDDLRCGVIDSTA